MTYYFPIITYIYVIVNINGDIMGRVNQYYEDKIEEEMHDFQDGLIKEEDLSDDVKKRLGVWIKDKPVFKSLNVRESVYEQIKRIAERDNRTISTTVAIMVKKTIKEKGDIRLNPHCGNGCGCPEPCDDILEQHSIEDERFDKDIQQIKELRRKYGDLIQYIGGENETK